VMTAREICGSPAPSGSILPMQSWPIFRLRCRSTCAISLITGSRSAATL